MKVLGAAEGVRRAAAFRLSRHHLIERAPAGQLTAVAGSMGGAQAQILSAAMMSLGSRLQGCTSAAVDSAVWKERTLVRMWCMRRTMYLVPSSELAVFARGSARRAEREVKWVERRGVKGARLEKLLAAVSDALGAPLTQQELGRAVSESLGYRLRYRTGGGGWGNSKKMPWVDVAGLSLPSGYLLHLAGAGGVICSGPARGTESTFVRADRWVPGWRDMKRERAEKELLRTYLRAFGPATVEDYATWTGMLASDTKEIWTALGAEISWMDVGGRKTGILEADTATFEGSRLENPVARLLPYFDSFLLGHRSHRNVVDEHHHRLVYRPQGWVSPVVLVDGRAAGTWTQVRAKEGIEVRVGPFSKLSRRVVPALKDEAERLGSFLGAPSVALKLL